MNSWTGEATHLGVFLLFGLRVLHRVGRHLKCHGNDEQLVKLVKLVKLNSIQHPPSRIEAIS